ncbi:MAG TPA: FtsW/RodA/SpoVE family cell cycle protein [Planctomycetaceae bacterium]|nr:FtsW/RodA/SpoVE family cell cycle protein [Planctomycetaceae bacterium]
MTAAEWIRRIPWSVVASTLALMAAGLSGIDNGDTLAGRGDYFSRQLVWILLSLPVMFAATLVSYRKLRHASVGLFAASLVLLVAVYFMPARNGAQRWIPLGVMYFQPSELAKLAWIMALAQYLMHRRNYRRLSGLLVPFGLTLLPMLLILREPDLGTALVFLPVLYAMLFAAGARPRHLALVAGLGLCVLPVLWMGMSGEQRSRVVSLFTQRDGGPRPRGDGYHLHQSKQMLVLGGVWGSAVSGRAGDEPQLYHLPAARTDFVFCLVGERWGAAGASAVLAAYLVLFASGLKIAAGTREPFGRLLAVGIVGLLATQAIINTGMTVGLMPITGLTLPLVSYGGSSLLATCVSLGLLMNVGMRRGYEMTGEPFRFGGGRVSGEW